MSTTKPAHLSGVTPRLPRRRCGCNDAPGRSDRDLRSEYRLACPHCGQAESIVVGITCTAILTIDGTDPVGDHAWDEASPCRCTACDHVGTIRAFTLPAAASSTGRQLKRPRKSRRRTGSWDAFEQRFDPIVRDDDTVLWELDELPDDIDGHTVWTVLDCEGRLYVSPDNRFVNRFAYVVCRVPWTPDDEDQPLYRYDD